MENKLDAKSIMDNKVEVMSEENSIKDNIISNMNKSNFIKNELSVIDKKEIISNEVGGINKENLKSNLKLLAIYPKITKLFSSLFIVFSFLLLTYVYDYSIAFISTWILCTPIFLLVIMLNNNLSTQVNRHKSKSN